MSNNLVALAKESLISIVLAAYEKAVLAGSLPPGCPVSPNAEIPKDASKGDYATSFALASAKALKLPPKSIADALLEHIDLAGSLFESVEFAPPGFLNFRLSAAYYKTLLGTVSRMGSEYGRGNDGDGLRVNVEFVSANPTGPMTIGNARGGVLGDTLAAVLEFSGYDVTREFYLNDAGNQIDLFGKSLYVRYHELIHGGGSMEFPENGYHGDDIRELALAFREEKGDAPLSLPEEACTKELVSFGLARNVERMKQDLLRYGVSFDVWFSESSLYESGAVEETIDIIGDRGYTYENDGALWFKCTSLGLEKDEVLRRGNGFYTYYAADIAYHRNKFDTRKFDKGIDIFGADHHGHTLRFRAGMEAVGIPPEKLDFVVMQLVRLQRGGETVRMSKRTGKAITLSDLLDEIPKDAVRFLFNMQKPDSHLEFDMELAVTQSNENPLYYVQYAHARIASLLKALKEEENASPPEADEADSSLLTSDAERELLRLIAAFPEDIRVAARDYEPSRINRYLIELAGGFHRFYSACRIKGEAPALRDARLLLAASVKTVLKNGLTLLGVSAPEKM